MIKNLNLTSFHVDISKISHFLNTKNLHDL